MATREVKIGGLGPFLFDDAEESAVDTDGTIHAGIQEAEILKAADHIEVADIKVIGPQEGPIASPPAATAESPTLQDVSAVDADVEANFQEIKTQLDALITDVSEVRTSVNSILTALRTHGLIET